MKNFLIMPNGKKDKGYKVTREAIELLTFKGGNVFCDKALKKILSDLSVSFIDISDKKADPDCIIVIGGDGSILDSSAYAIERDIPILGINMGRLGYLSEIPADMICMLERLFNNDFKISKRMTLEVSISSRGERTVLRRAAVNDVVVSHGNFFGIADLELDDSLGNSFSYRADGIILSTPTGSTAYSLSAGGPAIDSSLEAICVTPICAHTFLNRSILFSPELSLSVRHISEKEEKLYVSIDGIDTYSLSQGDTVSVTKSDRPLKLISLDNTGILGVLYQKMKI